MPFSLTRVNRLTDDLNALEDDIVDGAERAILESLKLLNDEIQAEARRFNRDGDGKIEDSAENFRVANEVVAALGPALQQLAEDTRSDILQALGGQSEALADILDAAGFQVSSDQIFRVDPEIIGAFLNTDLSKFNGGAQATVQVIQEGILNQMTGVSRFRDMVNAIEMSVIGQEDRGGNPLTKHARTWAMSAVISFENEAMSRSLDPEDVGGLYYSGPQDQSNRFFCAERVGKVFLKEDLADDVAANPIGGSSLRLPGGFNCRHVLVPVPKGDPLLEELVTRSVPVS